MNSALYNPSGSITIATTQAVPIQLAVTGTMTISAGAAGYVDTDASALIGIDNTKIWIVQAICATAQLLGARKTGDASDPKMTNTFGLFFCNGNAGHLDLYRNATTDVAYKINGYIKVTP